MAASPKKQPNKAARAEARELAAEIRSSRRVLRALERDLREAQEELRKANTQHARALHFAEYVTAGRAALDVLLRLATEAVKEAQNVACPLCQGRSGHLPGCNVERAAMTLVRAGY